MTVFQDFRYIVIHNALSQTFRNGSLTYTRFTDKDRVVLVAAGENLDDPVDLIISADDRIDFPLFGLFIQVHCKAVQISQISRFIGLAAVFGKEFFKGLFQFVLRHVEAFQDTDSQAAAFMKNGQQQMFRAYIGITQFIGLFHSHFQHSLRTGCCVDFTGAEEGPALAVLGQQLFHRFHRNAQGI